ncbi:hypothetical protein Pst134EB_020455 [Puccinia striiformis f. sp. tritici]|nr:hypothetical protein Pst134EB_020455 [Puccinia striiformis f. sp. tritici]
MASLATGTGEGVPEPSRWSRLISTRFNDRSISHWTSIFKAEVDKHTHPELTNKLSNRHLHAQINEKKAEVDHWIAIKVVSPHLNRPPHDTLTEIKTLSSLDHPNVVPLLDHWEPPEHPNYCLFIPLYPLSLYDLLNAQTKHFHPSNYAGFDVLTRRIIRDVGAGLIFLHDNSLAHRDINPSNVVLTRRGQAVLIDFGTVWPGYPSPESDSLEFELGTMAYRAPELLFGSRSYSPFGLDIWSFGALIAEFYTPMERESDLLSLDSTPPRIHAPDNHGESSGIGTAMDWYCFRGDELTDPSSTSFHHQEPEPQTGPWVRKTLFDGSIGDIGLAGNIFKIRGTPDSITWPESKRLPDFSKLNFHQFPKQDLEIHLPNLSYTLESYEKDLSKMMKMVKAEEGIDPKINDLRDRIEIESREIKEKLDLIESFLTYESTDRIKGFRQTFDFQRNINSHSSINDSRDHLSSSSWVRRVILNEDQICSATLDAFFASESDHRS